MRATPPEAEPESDPAAASGTPDFNEMIQRLDDGHFEVRHDLVRTLLARRGDAVAAVEVTPAPGGLHLGERAGVYRFFGLEEGDVLRSANDRPLTGADELRRAFADIRPGRPLVLSLSRGGRDLVLVYAAR
jgi:S1-C subfamily serine protease